MARANVDGNTVEAPYGGKFMGPKAEEVIGVVADGYRYPYEVFAGQK